MSLISTQTLSTQAASSLIETGLKYAATKGWKVTVAVADVGGNLVALKCADGAMPVSTEIAAGISLFGCILILRALCNDHEQRLYPCWASSQRTSDSRNTRRL